MPIFEWNELKNRLLKPERGIGFEDVVDIITSNLLLEVREHSNLSKYPNQKIYIFLYDDYVYACPYIEKGDFIFLKTIFPSRKLTKEHREGKK